EESIGVDADVLSEPVRSSKQSVDTAAGVRSLADWVVTGVGGALARRHARMALYELSLQIEANRLLVDASSELLADESGGHRVQGAGNLHVVIWVHLGVGPTRNVEWLNRRGQ